MNDKDEVKLETVLIQADVTTPTGRVYSKRALKDMVAESKTRKIYGGIGTPVDGVTRVQDISHEVTDLSMDEEGKVHAAVTVLDTPKGKLLKQILQSTGRFTVSGRGTLNARNEVEEFELDSVNFDPDTRERE